MRTTNQLSSVLSGGRFALQVGVASAIEPGVVKFGLLAHTLEAPLTQQDLTPHKWYQKALGTVVLFNSLLRVENFVTMNTMPRTTVLVHDTLEVKRRISCTRRTSLAGTTA